MSIHRRCRRRRRHRCEIGLRHARRIPLSLLLLFLFLSSLPFLP